MTRSSNRDIEQHYFDQFRAHFPLPAGGVEHGDKPDVVIHGERKLGIEIANLYLTDGADHSSEQVQRQRREAVVREAQKLHALAGGRNIELTVSFNPDRPIAEVKDLANALARVAYSTQHLPVGALARQHFERISQLQFIYHNPTEYPDALWRVSQVFTVPNLSVGRVAQLVATKEQRLADYRRCDTYWLLLVVDFIDPAQDQEISWPANCTPLNTTFERVLIYKPQFAQWTEVPIER